MVSHYTEESLPVYEDLLKLVEDKDYFALTTNVDHAFLTSGVAEERLFATQGDYGLFQCSVPCSQETWSDEEAVRALAGAASAGSCRSTEARVSAQSRTLAEEPSAGQAYARGSFLLKGRNYEIGTPSAGRR